MSGDLVGSLKQLITNESVDPRSGPPAVSTGGQLKLYQFVDRDPGLGRRLITHPGILEPLTSLLGPNIIFQTNRHNQASVNGPGEAEARLHRDVLQWSRNVITAIVYLEDSTTHNGCTQVIPGSQFAPFFGVPQPDGGGTWLDAHDEIKELSEQVLPVPASTGDVLLLDSLTFHSVGRNAGNTTRMSIALSYRSVDELDPRPLDTTQILVAGDAIYRGNERARSEKSSLR
ncbi:phytanoyl-CoA dioxygenase family protein [Catenuloplanes niger]